MSKKSLGLPFEYESWVFLCYGDAKNYVCNAWTSFKGITFSV